MGVTRIDCSIANNVKIIIQAQNSLFFFFFVPILHAFLRCEGLPAPSKRIGPYVIAMLPKLETGVAMRKFQALAKWRLVRVAAAQPGSQIQRRVLDFSL